LIHPLLCEATTPLLDENDIHELNMFKLTNVMTVHNAEEIEAVMIEA
jgi:hypothetical protein